MRYTMIEIIHELIVDIKAIDYCNLNGEDLKTAVKSECFKDHKTNFQEVDFKIHRNSFMLT
ncbi:MAG: hypothetical protein WBM98_03860 [Maribacter sp.]|uniref:hypothetical protein n=1 Tax=Maribacter sp. TaxID=1897614 RepID=UPI003C71C747